VDIAFVDVELWGDIYNFGSNNNQMAESQLVSIFLSCLTATMRHNIIGINHVNAEKKACKIQTVFSVRSLPARSLQKL
jgi:hypothetical protein